MRFAIVLINILPVLAVGCISTILTIYACNYRCRSIKYVVISIVFRYLVYNPTHLYFLMYNAQWGKILAIVDFLCVSVTILLYKKCMGEYWNKLFFIAVLSDARSICCSQGSITVVSYFWNYNLMDHIDELSVKYNLIVLFFAWSFLILTQILGKELYRFIKRIKLKHSGFWELMLIVYYSSGAYLSNDLKWFFTMKETLVFGIFVLIGVFIFREKKKQLLEASNQYLLLQQDMILQYYESLKEQINLTKKMRHDINNHMQIIESIRKENSTEELEAYTRRLREQYEQLEPVYYCDNVVINALITNKAEKCRRENIRFEAQLEKMTLGEITEYDLASVLFNLLDNAIESCQKVDDEIKRFIRVSCYTESGQMLIHVVNGCVEKESDEKKRLFTSKPDKKRHGLGMGIIRENIRKYPGAGMTINHRDYKFEIMIHIPLRNDR